MIIGNFKHDKAQDTYTGELATLTVAARKVVFQPSEARGDKAPSHRVLSPGKTGNVELGAAWKKRSEEGRDYLSVKLDDPSLAQPLNCALVESSDTEGFILVWSRDRRQSHRDPRRVIEKAAFHAPVTGILTEKSKYGVVLLWRRNQDRSPLPSCRR